MSYGTTDGLVQSVELEKQIRELHKAVGNAVVDDKHVVFGTGSTQLINALVHALSPDADAASPPASVVATVPYYAPYREQTTMFNGRKYKWDGDTAAWVNASSQNSTHKSFIELVTSPNNPDTLLHVPVLNGSAAIVDRAYYWPHFTHFPGKPAADAGDREGHAGQPPRRGGHLRLRLRSDEIQMSQAECRRVAVPSHLAAENPSPVLHLLQANQRAVSSTAYAWVKCGREEDQNCYETLRKANIISRSGAVNEASSRYTRVSLLKSDDDFDVLLERLADLVNAEQYEASS
ncbi:hypothetical protein EJB05_17185, partial [Eragrostis curvula]